MITQEMKLGNFSWEFGLHYAAQYEDSFLKIF